MRKSEEKIAKPYKEQLKEKEIILGIPDEKYEGMLEAWRRRND